MFTVPYCFLSVLWTNLQAALIPFIAKKRHVFYVWKINLMLVGLLHTLQVLYILFHCIATKKKKIEIPIEI